MKKHILLIGGWNAIFEKIQRLGVDFSYLGAVQPSSAFDTAWLEKVIFSREVDYQNIGEALVWARRWQQQRAFAGVISFTENGLEMAAVLAEALGVAGLDLEAVMITRQKDWMRDVLQSDPELALPWKNIHCTADLEDFFTTQQPHPVIVKPISGAGSVGVRQIHNRTALEDYLASNTIENPCIAERFVESDETYSVETLSVNGKHSVLALSWSKNTGQPFNLVSHTIVPPPALSKPQFDDIEQTIKRFLTAVGLQNGAAHTECKIDCDGRVFIIESQTRVGGDRIWQMAEWHSGVKQIDLAIENLYQPIAVAQPKADGVAGFFCLLPPAGTVKAVHGKEALAGEDVIEYEFTPTAGTVLEPIIDNTQRGGYLLLRAANHAQLFARVQEIFSQLSIEYDNGFIWSPVLA